MEPCISSPHTAMVTYYLHMTFKMTPVIHNTFSNYRSDVTSFGDVFNLFPGKIGTVHMRTTEVGTWLLHCHVDDHLEAGMITTFTVQQTRTETADNQMEGWLIAVIVVCSVLGAGMIVAIVSYFLVKKRKA